MWKIKEFKAHDDIIEFMSANDIDKFSVIGFKDGVSITVRYKEDIDAIV